MKKKFKFPFFIAEISANHNGSLSHAKKLIKCAKDNGAHAVKFQTFEPQSMTIKTNEKILELVKDYGKITLYGTYIQLVKHPSVGRRRFLIMQEKLKFNVLALPSMNRD